MYNNRGSKPAWAGKEYKNGKGERKMALDYGKCAKEIFENLGGRENLVSAAHCATRLRFQLRDNGLRNEEAISDLEGVKGVFLTQSQFQIIFGSGIVNMVCDEVQKQLGTLEEKPEAVSDYHDSGFLRHIQLRRCI